MYLIFTELVSMEGLHTILGKHFKGYTILPGESCYEGKREKCATIIVYNHTFEEIDGAAKHIKREFNQECVDIYNLNRKQWHRV